MKRPKRKTAAAVILAVGILSIILGLIIPVLVTGTVSSPSVGIIGGTDTPTYAFLLMRLWGGIPFALVMLGFAAAAVGVIVLLV